MLGGNFVVSQKVARLFYFDVGNDGNEWCPCSLAAPRVTAGVGLFLPVWQLSATRFLSLIPCPLTNFYSGSQKFLHVDADVYCRGCNIIN
jgi:hypothetical protein